MTFTKTSVSRARLLLLLLVVLYFGTSCEKETKDEQGVLARVSGTVVSRDEFLKRFELTPRLRPFPSIERAKKSAILSLVGEKVLAAEGYKRGLDSEPTLRRLLQEIERESVIEEVYREWVKHKVEVSEEEMRKAYGASKHFMSVSYIAVSDSLDAQQADIMLQGGTEFSKVAQLFAGDLIGENGELPTKTVEWGKSDERLELAALELKPGEASGPIRIGQRTFFLRMEEHLVNRFMSEDDFQQQRPRLKKVLTNRRESRIFAQFLNELMADSQVRAEPKVYGWLVRNLEEVLNIETSDPTENTILRKEIEWSQITSDLSDQLHATLLTFKGGQWTVGQFLERLWFGSHPLNTKSKSDFRAGLYKTIERMIEDEFLAREGFRKGLDQRPSVRNELRIWEESLLAAQMRQVLLDTISITDAQVKTHFAAYPERFNEPEMVKVQEILVQDRALARKLAQQIREGADMAALARLHSKRKQTRETGGILDFFPKNAHGKLGEAAFRTAVGELNGPEPIGPYAFSVFKVLERKPEKRAVFKDVQHVVKEDLYKERSRMAINRFLLSSMASPVQVEWHALDTLQVSSINLLTMKLGFPGRMAAPMIHYLDGLEESLIGKKNMNNELR